MTYIGYFDLVSVVWMDAYGTNPNWQETDDVNLSPAVTESVGWCLHDGPDSITLVSNRASLPTGETHVCGALTIPKGCIEKITILKE